MRERREADEQLGYLAGKIEAVEIALITHKKEEEERWDRIETHMQSMKVKVGVAKALWAVLKAVGTVTLLILTFKTGDIPAALMRIFHFN